MKKLPVDTSSLLEHEPRSDFGRRLIERRMELGLSQQAVAAGAAMDLGYLDYLESSPGPDPSRATVLRLATVLQVEPHLLLGSGTQEPPGQGPPAVGARLIDLDTSESLNLLARGGVGRFVYLEPRGPVAVPVNFRMFEGDIVFRTAASTQLASRAAQQRVSFEVDHIDDALREGWSVLVSGRSRLVTDAEELGRLQGLELKPWAAGPRNSYIRITPEEITGRRIRAG